MEKFVFCGYLYNDEFYDEKDENELDEKICEEIGGDYNNIDPMDTVEFSDIWTYDIQRVYRPLDVAEQIIKDCVYAKNKL